MNHRSHRPAPQRHARSRLLQFRRDPPCLRASLVCIPRALEDTVRLWVNHGRALAQQLQELHQLQLDHLLQRKQQRRTNTTPADPHPVLAHP